MRVIRMLCVAAFAAAPMAASAVGVSPFATPVSAGDSATGIITAAAFEDFGMSTLSFEASGDMSVEATYTINPWLIGLSGVPNNSISLAFSVNGGAQASLTVTAINGGTGGGTGVGALLTSLSDGDELAFFATGVAGQSGNQITFVVETTPLPAAPIPLPASLPLLLGGFGILMVVTRSRGRAAAA